MSTRRPFVAVPQSMMVVLIDMGMLEGGLSFIDFDGVEL